MSQPLFETPPTLEDAVADCRAWLFDEHALVVDQASAPSMSVPVATFLTQRMEGELQRRYVSAGRKVRYIHDWRTCVRYEPRARDMLIEWGRATRKHSELITVCISPDAPPFIRIAAATGVGILRAAGVRIELASDLEVLLAQRGLAPRPR